MDLPYNWDFLQNNISSEKLAELRKRFMEEWRSGRYTKSERYRMSEFKKEDFGRSTRNQEYKGDGGKIMGIREESKDHWQELCSRDIEEVWGGIQRRMRR